LRISMMSFATRPSPAAVKRACKRSLPISGVPSAAAIRMIEHAAAAAPPAAAPISTARRAHTVVRCSPERGMRGELCDKRVPAVSFEKPRVNGTGPAARAGILTPGEASSPVHSRAFRWYLDRSIRRRIVAIRQHCDMYASVRGVRTCPSPPCWNDQRRHYSRIV
jgi:hypothetical protein